MEATLLRDILKGALIWASSDLTRPLLACVWYTRDTQQVWSTNGHGAFRVRFRENAEIGLVDNLPAAQGAVAFTRASVERAIKALYPHRKATVVVTLQVTHAVIEDVHGTVLGKLDYVDTDERPPAVDRVFPVYPHRSNPPSHVVRMNGTYVAQACDALRGLCFVGAIDILHGGTLDTMLFVVPADDLPVALERAQAIVMPVRR